MRAAIKHAKVVPLEDGHCRMRLIKRCNTRRNRRLAWAHLLYREEDLFFKEGAHWSAKANRISNTAWLAENIERGVTLKALSAWTGCTMRKLSKRLSDYRHGRLPGQKEITA